VEKTLGKMADASVQLSCLQGYRIVQGTTGNYYCSATLLGPPTYPTANAAVVTA
jgi:hypothetical protein